VLFELPSFDHVDVKSVAEALSFLNRFGEKVRIIGGGTDLLGLMKDRISIPEVLINIKSIPGMTEIAYDAGRGLRMGAAVTLEQLITSDIIAREFSLIYQAARHVGTTQLRFMGTIGGNLCQRPRCLYFRHPDFRCHKKGGTACYAVAGEHRYYHSILKNGKCVAAHPSDLAPALLALKARAVILSPKGEREVPLQEFFVGPDHLTETLLKSDELLVEVRVPIQGEGSHQIFLKRRIRHSADFALVSVAVAAEMRDRVCRDIRIALGGVAPYPLRMAEAETVARGKSLNVEIISEVAEASVKGARPLQMNGYKVDLTKTLVRHALTSLWQDSKRSQKS
jgi:xanthine dehydrogenase YagS FAD-binding subunit